MFWIHCVLFFQLFSNELHILEKTAFHLTQMKALRVGEISASFSFVKLNTAYAPLIILGAMNTDCTTEHSRLNISPEIMDLVSTLFLNSSVLIYIYVCIFILAKLCFIICEM